MLVEIGCKGFRAVAKEARGREAVTRLRFVHFHLLFDVSVGKEIPLGLSRTHHSLHLTLFQDKQGEGFSISTSIIRSRIL